MKKNIFLLGLSLLLSVNAVQGSMNDDENNVKEALDQLYQRREERYWNRLADNIEVLNRIGRHNQRQDDNALLARLLPRQPSDSAVYKQCKLSQDQQKLHDEKVVVGSSHRDLTPVQPNQVNLSNGVNADIFNFLNESISNPEKWLFLTYNIDVLQDDVTDQMRTNLKNIQVTSDEFKEQQRLLMSKFDTILLAKASKA